MILKGTVQAPSAAGSRGFDTDTILTAEIAKTLASQGFTFVLRYLSLNWPQEAGDLTTAEAEAILAAGLALGAVQHVRKAGWSPMAEMGAQDGQAAATNAQEVGLPAGLCIWLDLEGVAVGVAPTDIADYCNSWYAFVQEAGYVPGIYVGSQCGLSANQLSYDLKVAHYWKSASNVPTVPGRGYQMVQSLAPDPVDGISIDVDVTQADEQGDQAFFLYPDPPEEPQPTGQAEATAVAEPVNQETTAEPAEQMDSPEQAAPAELATEEKPAEPAQQASEAEPAS